ncbi:efflux RND transporter periplasmic adaptor subunit [Sinorhizobium meliloti]|uniref:efflux RND transporter periplasmic adaptor subunit n=1 Tax=Rhizobium meliloti TaxID=382 RepID=UPI003F18947E
MARSILHVSLQLIVALTLLTGCDESSAVEEPKLRPVETMVAKAEQSARMTFPGVVQAKLETDLAFRTLGRLVSRKVDVGDVVRKGDVIAEIDPLALQLAVRGAEADLRDAEAQLENAAITEKRKRSLSSTSAASIADLDLAEQGLKSAQAGVARARASLAKLRQQLGYAQLRAEFDGVVTATSVEVGQTVTIGQAVVTLARLDQRDVVVDVPETQLRLLRTGARFDVALQLDDTVRAAGVLREIGPEADTNTRTHRLKIAIDDAPEVFRLGSVVTATIQAEPSSAIHLPKTAVLEKDGTDNVWVIDPSTHSVSLRSVRLDGKADGASHVRVLSGLKEGEEVAVAGVNELAEGQKLRIEQEPRP